MGLRWRRLVSEVSKFLAVGGVATVVAIVLFNFLVHGFTRGWTPPLNGNPLVGYVIANFLGMIISYHGTRSWAFRDREPVHADGGRTAYLVINVVTMTLPLACLKISRDVLGLTDPVSDNISANVIGLALGMVARFYLFRTYVFQRRQHANVDMFQPYLQLARDLEEQARLARRHDPEPEPPAEPAQSSD